MKKYRNTEQAFTLVELSIVLVIIGLIIGGVLTGQQIIANARITNAINGIQSYQAQFQTYNQNYGALPGNDTTATTRFPGAGVAANGNGDGVVGTNGSYDSTAANNESRLVWAHMRAAGLVKGIGSNQTQPTNPFNGITGIQNGAFTAATGFPAGVNVVCMSAVGGDAAQAVDTRIDDGSATTGNIRATTGAVTAATTAYTSANTYILCARM